MEVTIVKKTEPLNGAMNQYEGVVITFDEKGHFLNAKIAIWEEAKQDVLVRTIPKTFIQNLSAQQVVEYVEDKTKLFDYTTEEQDKDMYVKKYGKTYIAKLLMFEKIHIGYNVYRLRLFCKPKLTCQLVDNALYQIFEPLWIDV